ncbi:MAG TPA: sensor domain-containing diguanylate cyclase [Burkholderiales bacterium]|nr:sensor domain-containing diguanylate cyclase [Burkholderiales bacterium]
MAAALVSVAIFCATVPFATVQLAHAPAFIPAYQAALVLSDLITAVLLFGQFNFQRSRALFALAGGYLFTAFIAFAHALTFPGVFSPTGLLGAGPQSTAWMFMFWHGGFPLFVIAYALLKDNGRLPTETGTTVSLSRGGSRFTVMAGVAAVFAIVCGLTLVATTNQDVLAVLVLNNRFTSANTVAVSFLWVSSLFALAALWWRRPHTVLDMWLMVVMCAWLFDIALSAVFNAARFDLGWYAGRIYGLFSASFLLVILLIENGAHYARLALLSVKLNAANESLELLSLQDGLTNLANRRFFDRYLAEQVAIARRHERPLALILFDVDAFKAYNDQYGHVAGDECLKQIATVLQSCCHRPADMAARYGGEEFAMILPDTDSMGAAQVAEAARNAIARLSIPHAHFSATPYVSISGGVAVLLRNIDMTAQQLMAAADQALYQAKHLGRNRTISVQAGPESPEPSVVPHRLPVTS